MGDEFESDSFETDDFDSNDFENVDTVEDVSGIMDDTSVGYEDEGLFDTMESSSTEDFGVIPDELGSGTQEVSDDFAGSFEDVPEVDYEDIPEVNYEDIPEVDYENIPEVAETDIEEVPDNFDGYQEIPQEATEAEESIENSERPAYDNMYDYMVDHNYGREDYETYSKDPEWQELNNALLEEQGQEPIDYSAMEEPESGSAYDDMYDYITSHNYGREDYETYSKDPEWQELNNALLEEQGQEPIDYSAYEADADVQEVDVADVTEPISEPEMFEATEDGVQEGVDEGVSSWMDAEDLAGNEIPDSVENIPDTEENIPDTEENIPDTVEDIPDTVEDIPDTVEDIPDTVEDIPGTVEDIPGTVENIPDIVEDIPGTVEDIPGTVEDIPDTVEDIPDTVEDIPGTVEDIPDTEEDIPGTVENIQDTEEHQEVTENNTEPPVEATENDTTVEIPTETNETGAENTEEIVYDINHNYEYQENLLAERPEVSDMFENGTFYEQGMNEYGFEGTCGETTQANTLNRMLGTNEFTENDVLTVAIENNLCECEALDPANCGGTTTTEFMQLYEEMNHRTGDQLNVELFEKDDVLNMDAMAAKLEEGSTLNIAVDASELWGMPRDVTDGAHYTDHWISVTGVDRDLDGNITGFQIIDSGGGESYLEKDHFERCYLGPEGDRVLDPTCIVVSKKGK